MYYEEADNGEILGMVPEGMDPISAQYVTSGRRLQESRAVDYGMDAMNPPTLGEGCAIFGVIGVIMFLAAAFWYIALPLGFVGIILYVLKKGNQ